MNCAPADAVRVHETCDLPLPWPLDKGIKGTWKSPGETLVLELELTLSSAPSNRMT